MNPSILIYGTIAIDTLITPEGRADSVAGGSGLYAALAARLLTEDLAMLGVVGEDFPKEWRKESEKKGVSFQHVVQLPGKTFSWVGQYESDMNLRTSLRTEEGVQAEWHPLLPEDLRENCRIIAAANVTPPLQYALLEQDEPRHCLRLADFMKNWIIRERNYTEKLLSVVDIALMNDEEAREYAQCDNLQEAGCRLLQSGPTYAIIKHGSNGSSLFCQTPDGSLRTFHCPALKIPRAVDPTGAGDSYLGALCGYLLPLCKDGKLPSEDALRRGMEYGSVVAGVTCCAFGIESLRRLTPPRLGILMKEYLSQKDETPSSPPVF